MRESGSQGVRESAKKHVKHARRFPFSSIFPSPLFPHYLTPSASTAVCLLVLGGACAPPAARPFARPDYPEIKVEGLIEVAAHDGNWDSPAFSPDGSRIVVQREWYVDPVLPYEVCDVSVVERDAAGRWGEPRDLVDGVYHRWAGRMVLPVQASFDHVGARVLYTRIWFDSLLSVPWMGTIRSHVESLPFEGGDRRTLIQRFDWGFKPTELIQHARVSPDGRYLAFYTREDPADEGVYLLDQTTGARFRLSHAFDKHPTWSPDGQRLYFHTVTDAPRGRFDPAANALNERSALGVFELSGLDDGAPTWTRRVFDAFEDGVFIYHKHPAEIPGTDLLVFHGRTKPDGKQRLFVRRRDPGSPVYELDLRWQGESLKAAKHAAASRMQRDVAFVAKLKGEDDYRHLMILPAAAIEAIDDAITD